MTTTGYSRRRRRGLWISLLFVVFVAFGSLAATLAAGWAPKLGLDLAGGTELVVTPVKGTISPSQQDVAVNIIRNRVSGFGVSGATVQVQGDQIIIQIPGVGNGRTLENELVTLAQLYFRPVACFAPPYQAPAKGVKPKPAYPVPHCPPAYQLTQENINVQPSNNTAGYTTNNIGAYPGYVDVPSIIPTQNSPKLALIQPGIPANGPGRYLVGPAVMTGAVVSGATAEQTAVGQWEVNLSLTPAGTIQWNRVAQAFFHQYIAVDLDGVVQSAPLILPAQLTFTPFTNGVTISGDFTASQANALATVLQYGSLPVALKILTSESVSPTLGHSALVAGLAAGLAGLALVLLYILLYYRLLGLVVVAGLAVTGALLYSIISGLGRTSIAPSFDLAGVTGIIVSIGITVDSYIVYFERLKDETRTGRSVRTSLDRGFASAWRTVLAADTVSFLAAVLLFFLAAGSVQGFAFFLGLSTLLDVFVTWFFTRPAVSLLGRSEVLTSMRYVGVAQGLAAPTGAPA